MGMYRLRADPNTREHVSVPSARRLLRENVEFSLLSVLV